MRSEERVARLRQRMEREGARAFAAVDVSNITYLTGFDGVFDEERAHLVETRKLLDGHWMAFFAARGTMRRFRTAPAGVSVSQRSYETLNPPVWPPMLNSASITSSPETAPISGSASRATKPG